MRKAFEDDFVNSKPDNNKWSAENIGNGQVLQSPVQNNEDVEDPDSEEILEEKTQTIVFTKKQVDESTNVVIQCSQTLSVQKRRQRKPPNPTKKESSVKVSQKGKGKKRDAKATRKLTLRRGDGSRVAD